MDKPEYFSGMMPKGDNGMYVFGDLADPQLARALEVMVEKMK